MNELYMNCDSFTTENNIIAVVFAIYKQYLLHYKNWS